MKKFIRGKKGITLIALIITIIVLLILAGVSLNAIIGENGIITRANEASFKTTMSKYKEDTEMYVTLRESQGMAGEVDDNYAKKDYIYCGDRDKNETYKNRLVDARALIKSSAEGFDIEYGLEWGEITDMEEDFFREHLAVEAGELIWFANSEKDQEVKWCLDLGIQVFVIGHGYLTETGEYVVGSTGEYGNTVGSGEDKVQSGIYCCAPDLKNSFNTGATYYVTYSNSGDTKIGDPIYKDAPSDWYDYGNQKWANIVTSSNGHLAYFVWVPRFMMKIDANTGEVAKTADNKLDIRFVDIDNNYVGSEELDDAGMKAQGYVIPDAFEFGGVKLSGIWVGKYEISDPIEPVGFSTTSTENSISVTGLTVAGNSEATIDSEDATKKNIKVSISGVGDKEGFLSDGPITIDGLSPDNEYTVTVTIPTNYLEPLVLNKKVRTAVGSIEQITAPDLTGFNQATTHYVTYNGGNEVIGDTITVKEDPLKIGDRQVAGDNIPLGWYDYTKNCYANIMTENKEKGTQSYWTWIPRYEYKINDELKSVDVVFITADKTKPDDGYSIPDGFKFGGKDLAGIWVGKAEISDLDVPSAFTYSQVTGGFKVTALKDCRIPAQNYTGTLTKAGTMYIVDAKNARVTSLNVNGNLRNGQTFEVNVGDTITGLAAGQYTAYWTITFNKSDGTQGSEQLSLAITVK